MSLYRKKPVVIEAVQVADNLDEMEDVAAWCHGGVVWGPTALPVGVLIETLEGTMRADVGDWIIKGVQGEFYPVKPQIFAATYEPVQEDWHRPGEPGPGEPGDASDMT